MLRKGEGQPSFLMCYDEDQEGFVPVKGFSGRLQSAMLLWNTETWDFEAATKGSGVGQAVAVENFPALISGTEIPITAESLPLPSGAAQNDTLDPLSRYKITDIDPTEGNAYFGYTDKDGGWYIMSLTGIAARYVKGDDHYTEAWDDRNAKSLNFNYFFNVF